MNGSTYRMQSSYFIQIEVASEPAGVLGRFRNWRRDLHHSPVGKMFLNRSSPLLTERSTEESYLGNSWENERGVQETCAPELYPERLDKGELQFYRLWNPTNKFYKLDLAKNNNSARPPARDPYSLCLEGRNVITGTIGLCNYRFTQAYFVF
jgi:hypothetical protein